MHLKAIIDTTQGSKCKSSIWCSLDVCDQGYKGKDTSGGAPKYNHVMTFLVAPSARYYIAWRYRRSQVRTTPHHPCWRAPKLLQRMPSLRWKALHSLEPTFPYFPLGLGILSLERDPPRWICAGVPSSRHKGPLLEVVKSFKCLGLCKLHTSIAFTADPLWLASRFIFTFGPSSWNVNHATSIKLWTLCLRAMYCSTKCPGVPPWYV